MSSKGNGLNTGMFALSILGLLMMVVASYLYLGIHSKKKKWKPMSGTVVNYIVDTSIGGSAPIIIYVWDDDSLSYTSPSFTSPPEFELSEEVPLYVNPRNPDQVIIDSFQLYKLIVVLGLVGFFFEVFSLCVLYFSKRV